MFVSQCQRIKTRKTPYISNNQHCCGDKQDTYPFLKGPTLADFMFVVVEHFLPDLDHLVAHILDLCHSLHKDTQKNHMVNTLMYVSPYHILHLM